MTAAFLSPPGNRLLLAKLIVLFSSTQLGLHFWPSSALVYGIRIDYLSPTLYFLDLLLLVFFLLALPHSAKRVLKFLPVLLVSLTFSYSPPATLSWSLHFLLYLAFFSSLSRLDLKSLTPFLLCGLLGQLLLGSAQVLGGHSLQGLFYWLGERYVVISSPSTAVSQIFNELRLRPYGTFGHPNVFAGYFVTSLLIIVYLKQRSKITGPPGVIALILVTCGVLLSQSRAAVLSLFGLIIPFYLLTSRAVRTWYFIFLTTALIFIGTSPLLRDLGLAVSTRLLLFGASLHLLEFSPLFGSGAGASLSLYPLTSPALRLLQPDHVSPTLLTSWFGFFGMSALISFFSLRRLKRLFIVLLPLLPMLLLDHYFFTSPQGLFILIFYLRASMGEWLKS